MTAPGAPEVLIGLSSNVQPIFRPKLLDVFTSGKYTAEDLRQDALSGLTVGVIALSLSMALGIASESTPAIGWVFEAALGPWKGRRKPFELKQKRGKKLKQKRSSLNP